MKNLTSLATETQNMAARDLDCLNTLDMLGVINREDARVAAAVAEALPEIAAAVDAISARMLKGGRMVYLGAGTSGRLGVLDASECPPTYGISEDRVIGLLAGGEQALRKAGEAEEDRAELGQSDLEKIQLNGDDSVVGITASGRTPYVLGGLSYARQLGALTVGVSCNRPAEISDCANIAILAPVGPEVISGSTRMKSGTAQKMILNMLSTGVMVRLGKTYGNLMVDVQPANEKLRQRATRLVQQITGLAEEEARRYLVSSQWEVKTAVVSARLGLDAQSARQKLAECGGFLRAALGEDAHAR